MTVPSAGQVELAIGIMSGTSADGIDAALLEMVWTGQGLPVGTRVLAHDAVSFPDRLRGAILAAGAGEQRTAADLARLHAALGDAYAEAALALAARGSQRPAVIGLHGQTVAHLPGERVTLQLGDAARVAVRTGIPVIDDFRSADVAAGGEGAPLTPFADHVLFSSGAPRAVLNIGGIANLTLMPDGDPDHVLGFDTGPGNMVLDSIARMRGQRFDRDGAGARRGRVVREAVAACLDHPFLKRRGARSTGREEFGDSFARRLVDAVKESGGTLDDALATATEFTAWTVAHALRAETPAGVIWKDVLVGGGGAANGVLMDAVRRALTPIPVRPTDEFGVPAEGREAVAFAILAAYRLRGLPNTLPRVTGASRAVSGGAIHAP